MKLSCVRTFFTAPKSGKNGPMLYSEGSWTAKEYTRTATKCPYVECDGSYWYVKQDGTVPASERPSASSQYWALGEGLKFVLVEFLVANFAKLGAAIFHSDFMFSQQGLMNGVESDDYKDFDPADPDGQLPNDFVPHYYVDFRQGIVHAMKGKFGGLFYSKNKTTMNEVEINMDKGYMNFYGPSNSDDENHDLPGQHAERICLLSMQFDTDPDSLGRFVSIKLHTSNGDVGFNFFDGISYTNTATGKWAIRSWEQILNIQ